MQFLYRISNNSYNKNRLPHATKEHCFFNFLANLFTPEDFLHVIADNVNDELHGFLSEHIPVNGKILRVVSGSNAASFRLLLEMVPQLPRNEVVFLHEDDYLYIPDANDTDQTKLNNVIVREGLTKADYVSLYDHPDKYLPPTRGGNPFVTDQGIERTAVFLTQHCHWKYTNSTTLTFAVRVERLIADSPIWSRHVGGAHPNDFYAFCELLRLGRRIATPIPGRATHSEVRWLTPLTDWTLV
jgi:hypothetical protein